MARDKRVLAHPPVIVDQARVGVANAAVRYAHLYIARLQFTWIVLEREHFRPGRMHSVTLDECHGASNLSVVYVAELKSGGSHPKTGARQIRVHLPASAILPAA